MATKFKRPHGTTANPKWAHANRPTDLIPTTDDPHGRGARMVKLCGAYTITQGALAGQRFTEIMLPWQRDLIRYTFGHTDEDGSRIVQRVGLIIGKGSGKSNLLAALALAVVKDSEQRKVNQRGLVLIVAAGLASAGVVFQAIHASVMADEHLRSEFKPYTARRALVHAATGIEIRVIPPDLGAAVGLRPVLLLIDEVHQAAVDSKDFAVVIDQLRRGMGNAGAEALEIAVTTAPAERSVGFYADWSRSMRSIRDGKTQDESTLPVLFVWPTGREDLDLEDDTQWWRGMPSLIMEKGQPGTMDASMLRKELEQAQQDEGGKSLELLLSQRMGIEPEERRTSQKAGLTGMWASAPITTAWPKFADRMAVALDPASGLDDLFAVVVAVEHGGSTQVISRQFLLDKGLERVPRSERAVYDRSLKVGELALFETYPKLEMAVFDFIEHIQAKISAPTIVGGDRWGVSGMVSRLQANLGETFVDVPQGWKLASALSAAEGMLSAEMLTHADQPLLNWNIGNLVVDNTGPSIKFKKADAGLSGQGVRKIDGAMALLSALFLLGEAPQARDIFFMRV